MNDSTTDVNTWEQLSLLPLGSRTITVTIAVDPEFHHAHYDIEIRDNASGDLVALHVMPHRNSDEWIGDLGLVVQRITGALRDLIPPF